jgi:gliding motility-associated-like protein
MSKSRCIFVLEMRRYIWLCFWISVTLHIAAQHPEVTATPKSSKTQFEFIPNKGQWHSLAKFKAAVPYGSLYLENASMVYDMIHPDDYTQIQDWKHAHSATISEQVPRRHAVRISFADVEFAPKMEMVNMQKHYYNYFLGQDKSQWVSEVHPSEMIRYVEVYKDVDFEISGSGDIKYQWVVRQPTAEKVSQIKCIISGADQLKIVNGELKIFTSAGILTDGEPYVYQYIDDVLVELNCRYTLEDSVLSYAITSDIDPDYPLIIDPKLIFSTYSGSVGDNFGFTATYDSRGNLYAGGIVDNQGPYPFTAGAYDKTWNGGKGLAPAGLPSDVSISKYDSSGTSLLWATYLGGKLDEYPHSLVVDRDDNLVILGTTYSSDFPVSSDAFQSIKNDTIVENTDIYVTKFSSDGKTLLGSTFIGGDRNDGLNQSSFLRYNYSDDYRGDIITDDDGNILVATCTFSDNMPTTNAFQNIRAGGYDGYVCEISPDLKTLNWATYLGGSGADALYSIKLGIQNRIYVAGGTTSSNLDTTAGVYGSTLSGNVDGLLAVIDKTDRSLLRLSYWGTPAYDQIYFIGLDADERIYAAGQTEGAVTKTTGAYGSSNLGQFVFRMDTLLQNVDLQTTFGNRNLKPNLTPSAFLIDVCDHIYFSGWGSNVDPDLHPGSTLNMPVTADAVQKETDGEDFYIIVFGRDAKDLLYATYFGGDSTGDHVDGGTSRFDRKGVVYQSVCSSCPEQGRTGYQDFPTTSGAVYTQNPSVRCSNASFKIDLQIKSAVIADFIVTPAIGCGPLNAQFINKSVLGGKFYWDFGDGDTSTLINPKHVYQNPGKYIATLTVIDSNTCNISSVYKREITVLAQSDAEFNVNFEGCDNKLTIENTSTNAASYSWDFGDSTFSESNNPKHQYTSMGTFSIKLLVNQGTPCASSYEQQVVITAKKVPQIKLYNVFTPNNDGLNDCFKFDGDFLECTEYSLKIYNRWGERVFVTDNPETCWTGGVFGQEELLPEGTYFFVLQLGTDKSEAISGLVEMRY